MRRILKRHRALFRMVSSFTLILLHDLRMLNVNIVGEVTIRKHIAELGFLE